MSDWPGINAEFCGIIRAEVRPLAALGANGKCKAGKEERA